MYSESKHTLDAKNRLTIPKAFREELVGKLVIFRASEGDLILMPETAWLERLKRVNELYPPEDRQGVRMLLSHRSTEVTIDNQNRIVIPVECLNHAEIKNSVFLVGTDDSCTIWAAEKWGKYIEALEKKYASSIPALEL